MIVGRHTDAAPVERRRTAASAGSRTPRAHGRFFSALAFLAVAGFVALSAMPSSLTYAAESDGVARVADAGQSHSVDAATVVAADRDGYEVVTLPPPPPPAPLRATASAPAAGVPDPGTAKAIAYDMVMARGWDQAQYDCLVSLWQRESGWNVYAHNRSSGAYGIPQSLPGSKMATAGADWQTNPATQITWGLGYISGRYGTPCGAWAKSQASGWY